MPKKAESITTVNKNIKCVEDFASMTLEERLKYVDELISGLKFKL